MNVQLPEELQRLVQAQLASGHYASEEEVIRHALQLLKAEQAPGKQPSAPRQGGQLRGKIQIADDFDTLPDDLAEAFGMKSQQTENMNMI